MLNVALVKLVGLIALGSVLAAATPTAPPSLSHQLAAQLADVLRLGAQQQALLRAVASRGREVLAEMGAAQLERRRAVVLRMERAVELGLADDEAHRAIANALRAARQGRLSFLAAGMAVALEVEALLDSGQLGRLDRFVPRLTVSEAARDALDLLEQRLDAACAERRSVGELAAATTQAVARGVARLLAACRAPASVVELAGRQVAASLGLERLTGRPSSDLQPALEQIVAWGRACRGSLDGPRLRPDRMLALTASLLDSPLLPAAVYPVRLQRRSLELVMICPVFSRYLS